MIASIQKNSLQLVQQIIFFVTEHITRASLHLDPATRSRLQKLEGKSISIHITDPMPMYRDGIKVYIFPTAKGIELSADTRTQPDASISLTAKDILNLLRKSSAPNTVAVDGDYALLSEVLEIIKGFDIDWENAVSPITGDVIAHHVGNNMRATGQWLAQSLNEAKRLAEEYMNEELPIAKGSASFKPILDGVKKIKGAGDAMRDKLAAAAEMSPFYKPKR